MLMTLTASEHQPSLGEAADKLGVSLEDLDSQFGVVPIDPEKGTYAVQVRSDKAPAPSTEPESGEYHGPWSNPKIAPFGPLKR